MKILLDGDLAIFAICAAAEYNLEDGEAIPHGDIFSNIDKKIMFLMNRLEGTSMEVFFTGKHNFRTAVTATYKANRANVWRPESLSVAKKYAMAKFDCFCTDGLEADDLMIIRQGECTKLGIPSIIATIDKDLAQGSGRHYGWETQHRGEYFITVDGYGSLVVEAPKAEEGKKAKAKKVKGYGEKFFHHQLLIGDGTDGIIGCGVKRVTTYKTGAKAGEAYEKRVGIGQLESVELLGVAEDAQTGLNIVAQAYMRVFGDQWQDQLEIQGRCLYMTREIDPVKGIKLWSPFGEDAWMTWEEACADHLPVEEEYVECTAT